MCLIGLAADPRFPTAAQLQALYFRERQVQEQCTYVPFEPGLGFGGIFEVCACGGRQAKAQGGSTCTPDVGEHGGTASYPSST